VDVLETVGRIFHQKIIADYRFVGVSGNYKSSGDGSVQLITIPVSNSEDIANGAESATRSAALDAAPSADSSNTTSAVASPITTTDTPPTVVATSTYAPIGNTTPSEDKDEKSEGSYDSVSGADVDISGAQEEPGGATSTITHTDAAEAIDGASSSQVLSVEITEPSVPMQPPADSTTSTDKNTYNNTYSDTRSDVNNGTDTSDANVALVKEISYNMAAPPAPLVDAAEAIVSVPAPIVDSNTVMQNDAPLESTSAGTRAEDSSHSLAIASETAHVDNSTTSTTSTSIAIIDTSTACTDIVKPDVPSVAASPEAASDSPYTSPFPSTTTTASTTTQTQSNPQETVASMDSTDASVTTSAPAITAKKMSDSVSTEGAIPPPPPQSPSFSPRVSSFSVLPAIIECRAPAAVIVLKTKTKANPPVKIFINICSHPLLPSGQIFVSSEVKRAEDFEILDALCNQTDVTNAVAFPSGEQFVQVSIMI
jgi:hypothetical protein